MQDPYNSVPVLQNMNPSREKHPKLLAHIVVGKITGSLPFACSQAEPAFPRSQTDLAEPRTLRNAAVQNVADNCSFKEVVLK